MTLLKIDVFFARFGTALTRVVEIYRVARILINIKLRVAQFLNLKVVALIVF